MFANILYYFFKVIFIPIVLFENMIVELLPIGFKRHYYSRTWKKSYLLDKIVITYLLVWQEAFFRRLNVMPVDEQNAYMLVFISSLAKSAN